MGFFNFILGSEAERIKEKVILTQKNRIVSLEKDIGSLKKEFDRKDDELNRARDGFERSKERLVEQIIQLSDKFAVINQRMLDIAHENARLKMLSRKKPAKKAAKKAAKKKAGKKKKP